MPPTDNFRQRSEGVSSKRLPATTPADYDNGREKRSQQGPDLDPNIWVVAGLAITFISAIATLFYYKVDNRNHGPFASYVNRKYPIIDRTLNNYGLAAQQAPLFGASAAETSNQISLTEEELKDYDGADPDKPIYLAINGTIFDVSSSPAFYGPGGHYNHFVGKDATRAWITECWDEPEQLTWRLDDVEVMFMPKWLDEMLETVGNGDFGSDMGVMGVLSQEALTNLAAKAVERFGKVGPKAKAKRRISDKEEARAKVQETVAHWVEFFAKNEKYRAVGTVVRDEGLPTPPAPCEAAMKKRTMKGGKLEALMGSVGNLMGRGGSGFGNAVKNDGGKVGEMPAAVREQIEKAKKEAAAAAAKDSATTKEAGTKATAVTDAAAKGAETVKQKAEEIEDEHDEL